MARFERSPYLSAAIAIFLRSRRLFVGDGLIFPDLFGHIVGDLANQNLQTHDAALARFEGLAVLAVHCAETDVRKFGLRGNQLRLSCYAEDLLKVQALALVGEIENLSGVEVLLALDDGGKVGCRVERCAVGFEKNARRNFLRVGFFLHGNDKRAVGLDCQMLVLDDFEHRGDIRLRVGLSEPDIKADVEVFVVLLEVLDRNAHDLLPHGAVAALALLE